MDSFFNKINVSYIDHFAVTTGNFNSTVQDWLSMPNSKLLRGPGENKQQQVKYAFVQLSNGSVIEVLSPLAKDSPITSHVDNGGGFYHVCFAVSNINDSIQLAKKNGATVVVKPIKDIAFDERHISFIMHPDHGLIELVEKQLPFNAKDSIQKSIITSDVESNIEARLIIVINDIFPDTKNLKGEELVFGCVEKWDSLGQLQLIMAIEQVFEVSVPVEKVTSILSFWDILEFLGAK